MNKGIVLKRINYEETSFILNVLKEDDFVSLIVRGAKRKNSEKLAISEPISLINFVCSKSKTMPTLIEGTVINEYEHIKESLEKITIASLMSEFILISKDAIIDKNLSYNLLKDSLDVLNSEKNDIELCLFKFEIVLLKILGSTMNENYLKEEYSASNELLDSLKMILNGENHFDHLLIRNFFKEYFMKECGIYPKSYKMYENLFN